MSRNSLSSCKQTSDAACESPFEAPVDAEILDPAEACPAEPEPTATTFFFDLFFRDSILNRGMPFCLYCMIFMLDHHAEMMQGEPKQQEDIFLRQQQAWTRLKAWPLIFQCGGSLCSLEKLQRKISTPLTIANASPVPGLT